MNYLPIEKNLTDVTAWEGDSLTGTLRCKCGSEHFCILHDGIQTRIFFRTYLSSDGKPFVIIAQCASCSKKFLLHWSEPEQPDTLPAETSEFTHHRVFSNCWRVRINYSWRKNGRKDGHWNSEYDDVNIDIWNDEHPRKLRVFES